MTTKNIEITKITLETSEGIVELSVDMFEHSIIDTLHTISFGDSVFASCVVDESLQNTIKEEFKDIDDETFVDIEGYEGLYQINKRGEVKNKKLNRMVKGCVHKNRGYQIVPLRKNNKPTSFQVHRIVAQTFLNNPLKYQVVDHMNNDKLNNHISNLRFVTQKENTINKTAGNEIEMIPEQAIKIDSIRGFEFDNLYYCDCKFYQDHGLKKRVYNGYKYGKQLQWTLLDKTGNKITFTQHQFLKEYPEFATDFIEQTIEESTEEIKQTIEETIEEVIEDKLDNKLEAIAKQMFEKYKK